MERAPGFPKLPRNGRGAPSLRVPPAAPAATLGRTSMTMRSLVLSALTALALAAPVGVAAAAPKAPTCDGLTATIVGTNGDDTLTGTTGDDVIVGLGGDDVIVGDLGADRICGGTGDDTLSGHGD